MKYDAVIVLGSKPNTTTWKFPSHVYKSLAQAADLHIAQETLFIVVSGGHALKFDSTGEKQPFRECDAMADYLIEQGIPDNAILREGESRDTISNLYYIKKQFLLPKKIRRLAFIMADWRIPRLEFLCQRILGEGYTATFIGVPHKMPTWHDEVFVFQKQREFLEPMADGDHSWLDDKFYDSWLYKFWDEREKLKTDKG